MIDELGRDSINFPSCKNRKFALIRSSPLSAFYLRLVFADNQEDIGGSNEEHLWQKGWLGQCVGCKCSNGHENKKEEKVKVKEETGSKTYSEFKHILRLLLLRVPLLDKI